jgi:hypothetical protein
MLAPAIAAAQHTMGGMPAHEAGVDLSLAYFKPSGRSGVFMLGTPVDVRLGFIMQSGWTLEPRVILKYASGGGASAHNFDLDVNALFPMGAGATYKKGMYLTVGGGLDFTGSSTTASGTVLQINGGIGTRVPYESGAIRLEAYAKYHFQDTAIGFPNTFEIGGRVGLSLWH